MISIRDVLDGWNHFFHAPEYPATIALFRVLWGLLIALDAALMLSWSRLYFGPEGWLSAARHREIFGKGRFSLFNLLPETDRSGNISLWLLILSSLSLAACFYTRTSAVLCFVTMVSLHHRNPCVFHSGDSIARLLTLLLGAHHCGNCSPSVGETDYLMRFPRHQTPAPCRDQGVTS